MKRNPLTIPLFLILCLLTLSAFAQVTSTPMPAPDATMFQPVLDALLGKYGWLAMVVTVLGSLRLVFKPVMLAIELFVQSTPSTTDDQKVAQFEASSLFRWLTWGLDYVASIKVPAKTATTTQAK